MIRIREYNKNYQKYTFLMIFVFLIGVFGGLIFMAKEAKADQANSSVNVTNSLPTASSVSIDSAAAFVTLIENTTKTVTATFVVTDNNGCQDIDSGTPDTIAKFYRTNVAGGAACTPDNANCYAMVCVQDVGTCTVGGADLTATYTCTSAVQFYADPTDATAPTYSATDWTATATPRDSAGTDGTPGTDTIEMNSLTALDVTATINYGSLALGANTGVTDQTTIVTNTGNRQIDTQLDGYGAAPADGFSMVCTIGNITLGNEKYSATAATAYASKTALSGTPTTLTLALVQGVASTKNVYWGFGLPATGVGGSCTGKVNFTPVNNP